MDILYQNREWWSVDWSIGLFVLAFALLAVNRLIYHVRFEEFMKLPLSDKYIKIYRDPANLKSSFTISMFAIQLVSFSFLILLFLGTQNYLNQYDWIDFIKVINFLILFVITKYLIEKIISELFDIQVFADRYNLLKVNYRTYLGIILLPLSMLMFFQPKLLNVGLLIALVMVVFINVLLFVKIYKSNRKAIVSNLFYFILYLCTLEIAPYLILYKWIENY
ncbi:MAG TPA: DUF4271 domain-containing protein [Flavobacterium sp.]|nr:DUF4271 domain-containing protein [Flavobacterium sp.]